MIIQATNWDWELGKEGAPGGRRGQGQGQVLSLSHPPFIYLRSGK